MPYFIVSQYKEDLFCILPYCTRLPVLVYTLYVTMAKSKKGEATKKKAAATQAGEVPLKRQPILDGYCEFLAPSPITNSGRADNGGWMDRIGIEAVGLGHIFTDALGPMECFYSNEAFAAAGFCTMQLELHPPLETIGDASTAENLKGYLEGYCQETENEHYQTGNYRSIPDSVVPPVIADPSTIGSPASMIVQLAFEVELTIDPRSTDIPHGMTAITYVALVHFANKGNVLFKANNFHRHAPPLDYEKMLASISYKTSKAPYHGPDPSMSGLRGLSDLINSGGDWNRAKSTMARAQAEVGTLTNYCHKCGADKAPDGGPLMQCGKCKASSYCSRECQTSDWKRHKRDECRAREKAESVDSL
jgi:hypothetical protein